ncbi:MAG: SCP2 sterol-binding domain-containing protein [Spirosomataceae bacterium]
MSLQSLTERIQTLIGTDSGLDATFKFITDEGIISVDTKQIPNMITNDDLETECAMEISTKNALDLLSGELNPMMAYMMGKLKIKGDMAVAMKIAQAFGG